MEAFDFTEINAAAAMPILAASDSTPDADVTHLRALRRKARRISAYARFNVEALTSLAVQVETDIAGLQH